MGKVPIKWLRNIDEYFNRLSRAHDLTNDRRTDRQTDGRL